MKYTKLKVLALSCFLAFTMMSCKDVDENASDCQKAEREDLEVQSVNLLNQKGFLNTEKLSREESDLDQAEGLRYIFTYSAHSDETPNLKIINVECTSSSSTCNGDVQTNSSTCVISL